ncbi:helix-turn-helix transcriptional regulator [Amycolatopsis acidicola]|uniref:Helix-turn-helix transcriptional regulator n=1 Tax=Amycolatopsis acidicola TaxID=2596893 RepID=A0A5N0UUR6_9PSEU|nr:LuxR family transcriptional regulator [Amycolatopsis acidicola]KAA9153512.1 helix-turn-helix transcriptional regulator [Amycolatopsis acidicola]
MFGEKVLGRDRELTRLREALELARGGQGTAIAIVGGTGLGKTTLLSALVPGDLPVWRTCGETTETSLPLAGLHRLNRTLTPALPGGRFARCVAVHEKIAAAGPLLCLIDNADLLDEASREVLTFAARRLSGLPVLMVFTARESLGGITEIRLGPLEPETSARLLPNEPELVELASGNPLALAEFGRRATLPRHSRLRVAIRAQLRDLPDAARTFVLMAALDDRLEVDTLVRAAAEADLDLRAVEAAREAGLLTVDGDAVTLADELVRYLVRAEMALVDRRATHRLLASVLDPERHKLRRIWHRLALAGGTETAELTEAAASAAEAGEHLAAADAYERAAELTPQRSLKARHLLAAADDCILAGRPHRARVLLRRSRPLLDTAELRGRTDLLHGQIELHTGMPAVAAQTLVTAADLLACPDREAAVRALMLAGEASCVAGDSERYFAIAAHAAGMRQPDDPPAIRLVLDHFAGMSASFAGSHSRAAGPLRRVVGLAEVVGDPAAKIWASQAAYTLGDAAKAHELAVAAVTGGHAALVPWALVYVSITELLQDRLSSALASSEEGVRLAKSQGQPNAAIDHLTLLALEAALRGDGETTRLRLDAAARDVAQRGLGRPGACSSWASACVDLADDRPEDALDRFRLMAAGAGPVHPGIRAMATPHFVEAAARCGQRAKARAALKPFEDWARSTGSAARLALAHRCHALLAGDDPEADEHFRAAIELHRTSHTALELAKTELFYGYRLRRNRKNRAARELLRDAWKIFRHYDAPRWADRAQAELRAAGESVPQPDQDAQASPAELTPQQLQIARLVAEGATNREVAAQLYLSPRTVDHHLRNIFARLGVRSRVELTGMLK